MAIFFANISASNYLCDTHVYVVKDVLKLFCVSMKAVEIKFLSFRDEAGRNDLNQSNYLHVNFLPAKCPYLIKTCNLSGTI